MSIVYFVRSGDYDPISSPSAKIVMGQVVGWGTGAFTILEQVSSLD